MATEYRDEYRREEDLTTLMTANKLHARNLFFANDNFATHDGFDAEDTGLIGYTDDNYTKAAPNFETSGHCALTLDWSRNPEIPIGENGIHVRHSTAPTTSDVDLLLVDNLPGSRSSWPKLWWDYSETSFVFSNYRLRIEYDSDSYALFEMADTTGDLKIIPTGDDEAGDLAIGNISPEIKLDVDGDIATRDGTLYLGQYSVNGTFAWVAPGGSVALQYRSGGSYSTIASFDTAGVLNLTNLSVSKLIASDASKNLISSDLDSWVADAGSGNILVVDDGNGGITLDTVQNIGISGTPTFADITVSNIDSGGVVYSDASNVLTADTSYLFWDYTNKRLGIGTGSPSYNLHVKYATDVTDIATLLLDGGVATTWGGGQILFSSYGGTVYSSIKASWTAGNDPRMLIGMYDGASTYYISINELAYLGLGVGDADADEMLHLKGDGSNGAMIKFANSTNYIGNIGAYGGATGSLSINRDTGATKNLQIYDGTTNIAVNIVGNDKSVDIAGFITLGTGAPPVKQKKLEFTSYAGATGTILKAHGLTYTKILGAEVFIHDGTYLVPSNLTGTATYHYEIFIDTTNVLVKNISAASLVSKAGTILITYEE